MNTIVYKEYPSPAIFTLLRADGVEKKCRYAVDEPGMILLKGTGITNGQLTPKADEHDRFDLNVRAADHWWREVWLWLNGQIKEFSEGMDVRVFYVNPYCPIGGFVASD